MKQIHLQALVVIAMLSGCATLNEDQCRTADWYELGFQDGGQGKPRGQLQKHRKACSEYGIHPDDPRYQEGRERGLRDYCRVDNAVLIGLDGKRYQGVCPPRIDRRFREANEAAYAVYKVRQEIERVDDQLASKERQLLKDKLKDKERRALRHEIRNLDRKRVRLRDDLHYRERELDRLTGQGRNGW